MIYQEEKLPSLIYDDKPQWIELYQKAWQIAFGNIETDVPEGWLTQLTCMPGSGTIWQWDSCFLLFYARFSNNTLFATNNLDNIYRLQREDGYISMAYNIRTQKPAFPGRINPPLYAWAEWEHYLVTGNNSRFERILPILTRYFDWVKANRRWKNGLYWFEDSGSSGMDNAPRGGWGVPSLGGSDVCYIDLACQQALSAYYLAKIADTVGDKQIAARFICEYEELKDLINKTHWSEKVGFYFDLFSSNKVDYRDNFINHKTIAAFWPLLAGIASDEQAKRLLEHLLDPNEFNTTHPVPSLSKDDPNYEPLGGYWRGGVWAPTNYMVVKGLKRYNKLPWSREIALKHLDVMYKVLAHDNYGSIWECYSPEYYQPAVNAYGKLVRPNFVGWSGLGPIAMLLECVFGLEFDASENCITWVIATEGRHGIENLLFNGRIISLICQGKSHVPGETQITVETSGTLKLRLSLMGQSFIREYELEPGAHTISI
jgi:glycogen debranching enzyme